MPDDIFSYAEMCTRENGAALQHGMNYQIGRNYSVILMSRAPDAPYRDRIEDEGKTIIYEGHDVPKSESANPKLVDQQRTTPNGTLTRNGKFHYAAQLYKEKKREPEKVRVYEKIKSGIWAYNGTFDLTDSWIENDGKRNVFMFKLELSNEQITQYSEPTDLKHVRVIPTSVKREVWIRDGGKCVQCGATDNLHFDHIIPFTKGGASITAANIQILCARHNIQKSNRIS